MSVISNFPGGASDKINSATDVKVIAADKISIGDTVYTINGVHDIEDKFHPSSLDGTVCAAAFSPDGKTLVLGGDFTGKAKVYSVSGTTVTYVKDIYPGVGTTALGNIIETVAFSPDGKTLVLGGGFTGYAKVYSVSGTTVTYVQDIYADAGTTALSSTVNTAAFSPDGKTLVLGGDFTGKAKVYSVSGTTIDYVKDIHSNRGTTDLDNAVYTASFSPDGKTLVLGGYFTGKAKVYSAWNTSVEYEGDIYSDAGTTALNAPVVAAAFSPDGKTLVLGGNFTGHAKVYSVSGTTVTYVQDIYADAGTTALSDLIETAAFSPDGKTLVLGGGFTGKAKVYSVSGTTITYIKDIYADVGTTVLNNTVNTAAFSPDGKTLVLGGGFTGYAKVYSVSGTTVTYVQDIYADAGTTALSSTVNTAAFSPDGKTLVLGGGFTGRAKVYSARGTTITYVQDIYADSGTTALSSTVNTAAFSPDGKTLVLGGYFAGKAKVYSARGTTITYVQDIYADTSTTALGYYVDTAAFSPDGKTLVLGGGFTGHAKVYSVSGTTITYVKDIYANAGTTALGNTVNAAAFSPDGKTLVLGGQFTRYAKVYSVSGTTVTYVQDIYADAGTTALSSTVNTAAFSPDGKTLVLGGYFTGRAKVYSARGTTITYIKDIYADVGTTVLNNTVNTAAFSPDGKTLVLGGYFTGRAKVYSARGTTITYVQDIYADSGTTALSSTVNTAAFSPDGKTLVLGGYFAGRAKVYSVKNITDTSKPEIKYGFDVYADAGTFVLSSSVRTAAFSPDGKTLVLGGDFTGKAKAYSVSGTIITYVKDIYADAGTTSLDGDVFAAAFSPDGKTLVLGGVFTGFAKVYSASGTTITYVKDIYANAGTTALDYYVYTAAFSPDGKTLVLGGVFTGFAKVYSVSGTTTDYVKDIYADTGTTALSDSVYTAAFSPDGKTLVLGGQFTGRAKVYSVSGTTITYVQDIYADTGTTALNGSVQTAAFSPDGKTLVLGGNFTGFAKVYSASGTTATYVKDIYADTGTTSLNNHVNTAAFSPDGKTLVLGGSFDGYAKVYSVSGTTVTYAKDVYADAGTAALSDYTRTAAFSPDGTTLVLGGDFTRYAKVYSASYGYSNWICELPCAHSAPKGVFTADASVGAAFGIGYSKTDMKGGETGKVKLIAEVKLK